jgi:predicted  nucleic acid-binding Zn-ribbon protein
MPIEWDKIENKPTKEYKVVGTELLDFKLKLERNIAELTKLRTEDSAFSAKLEKKVADFSAENKQLLEKIKVLEVELRGSSDKIGSIEPDLKGKSEKIAALETELQEKNEKIASLETGVNELNNSIAAKDAELAKLNVDISEKGSAIAKIQGEASGLRSQSAGKESELENVKREAESMRNQLEELLKESDTKEAALKKSEAEIAELNTKNTELNKTVEALNAKITELKELIPKKPVYEKAEEVVKGTTGCPKCGWTLMEDYKLVDGKRQLIRKYCPNTFCMWTSLEGSKALVATGEAPKEEKKEVKLFRVKGTELEEIKSLDTSSVAIIADPAQNIIWVWKGEKSSRFEYAEATGLANKVKKDIPVLHNARIERIEEGKEPNYFPKL